jgi:hypothetical protein
MPDGEGNVESCPLQNALCFLDIVNGQGDLGCASVFSQNVDGIDIDHRPGELAWFVLGEDVEFLQFEFTC